MYRRFKPLDIVLHFTMMVTFIALVLTGLPLKFSHAPWAKGLMAFWGGAEMAGLVHRIAAAITFLYFAAANAYFIYFLFYKNYLEIQIPSRNCLALNPSAPAGRISRTSLG